MSEDKNPDLPAPQEDARKHGEHLRNQSALAMELPFTLVGAVVFAGLVGYLLDKWLHTAPWLMVALGGLGFVAGVREVIRRLPDGSPRS